jgi:ParE toxin of type II toxin-antitoxin system, parDE
MAAKRCEVKISANFEANLESIQSFLTAADVAQTFPALLDTLAQQVIPALEYHPEIGRAFLNREVRSVEARQRIKRISSRIGAASLREYIAGDFLILYAVLDKSVYLLSIKHHRQLSFDFPAHWR